MMLLTCKVLLVLAIVQYAECSERLVSGEKLITSSSDHKPYLNADKAIDGDARRNPDAGHCAATNSEPNPWYELDLKKTYSIHAINVVGRGAADDTKDGNEAGYGHTLYKMEIKLGTSSSDLNVQTTFNQNEYLYNYTLPAPKLGRYIRLTLRGIKQFFVICELYVYGDCAGKTYGKDCDNKCGMCLNGEACDSDTGNCSACSAGYQSPLCQECEPGTHGMNCVHQCGSCADHQPCNRTTGLCENGCFPGSIGPNCNMTGSDESTEITVNIVLPVIGGLLFASLLTFIIIKVKRRHAHQEPRRSDRSDSTRMNNIQPSTSIGMCSVIDERQCFITKGKHAERDTVNNDSAQSEYTSLSADIAQSQNVEYKELANLAVDYEDITNFREDADDHAYYGFGRKDSGVKVYQLWDFILERRKENDFMFNREFAQFPMGLCHPHETALRQENGPKNRYKGMYAYDNTRVPLKTNQGESDYINACYINGYGQTKKFIAAQGPTSAMIDDFWCMIWQQKSQQIVMLTNLIEKGKEKCLLYWPTDAAVKYRGITVSMQSEVDFGDYVVRKLNVQQTRNPRLVTQYHFKKWSDEDIPDNTWSLVNFWRTVAKDRDTMKDSGPTVVHCSAGIGRTGIFIALDNAYHQAKLEGSLTFPSIIRTLREQRVNMVQTCQQYIYVHEAVADALLFGTQSVSSKQFDEVYCFLAQFEPGTNLPRLRNQYDLIVSSIEAKEREMTDPEGTDWKQQTDMIHIGKPSLCAALLPNAKEKDAYIVAKTPDKINIPDLWSLIYKRKTKTIITLIDAKSQDEDIGCFNSDEKTQKISLIKKEDKGDHSEITLSYKPSGSKSKCVTVKQFVYSNCLKDENEPFEAKAMIELIENVLLWQQDISDRHPILVHCSTGSKLSGLVCVLLNELNRIKTEKERVNIVQSVKLVKNRNKDIIPSYEQYRYIHEVIRCFLNGGDLYANIEVQ